MADENKIKEILGSDYASFIAYYKTEWVGPFTFDDLLSNCLDESFPKPPESSSVYLVSRKPWVKRPTYKCIPLYVGSNTGKSPRFRTRIGDLIADAFGFYEGSGGHSSGGKSLYRYCKENDMNPKQLYIGWLKSCGCTRCAEWYYWNSLEPKLNKIAPPRCEKHTGDEAYLAVPCENNSDKQK
jgi:hypothetical protein